MIVLVCYCEYLTVLNCFLKLHHGCSWDSDTLFPGLVPSHNFRHPLRTMECISCKKTLAGVYFECFDLVAFLLPPPPSPPSLWNAGHSLIHGCFISWIPTTSTQMCCNFGLCPGAGPKQMHFSLEASISIHLIPISWFPQCQGCYFWSMVLAAKT